MDTPDHAKTPDASESPPAIAQPGTVAERPAGTVEAEWNLDVDAMLNRRGFAAFLENYDDAESFEVTEENKLEIAARFRAFEASKTVARQFELAANEKLRREGRKDRMNSEERQAYRDHVAELAAKNPDALLDLESDLRALEEHPEKIRQKEAELSQLKENWSAEKIKAGITELADKKAAIEKSLADTDSVKFSSLQTSFFLNFGARFGIGKIARHLEQKTAWSKELQEVDSTIKEAEEAFTSAPEVFAAAERKIREATYALETAQENIFAENKVAQMMRKRLISEAHKRCDDSLESMNIGVLQKAAEQFAADEKLAEAGSDYLDLSADPDFAEKYRKELNEQMKKAISAGIKKTLESLPAEATLSRFERGLRTFIELAGKEAGFMEQDAAKEYVINILENARKEARAKSKGSGKGTLLGYIVARLSEEKKTTASS